MALVRDRKHNHKMTPVTRATEAILVLLQKDINGVIFLAEICLKRTVCEFYWLLCYISKEMKYLCTVWII